MKASPAKSSVPDPDCLKYARQNFHELQSLLNNVQSKLSQVSAQVDMEFLSSYRVHILSVQSELKRLKHEVTKGEQALNSDSQVSKLENEVKWFTDECSRLRVHHDAMDKDYKQVSPLSLRGRKSVLSAVAQSI